MKTLGNIIWFLFGGFESALCWLIFGVLWCITIVGIPLGRQCFKFASLSVFPFKKEVKYSGGGASLIANILWLLFTGIEMFLTNAAAGIFFAVTIVGIPFAKQYFKLAKLSLMPFGAEIV